jgi:glycine/D-amino acid oxidase-like deaminating enzyme
MACPEYNVTVVGCGPIGCAAAYYCAKELGKESPCSRAIHFWERRVLDQALETSRQFRICYAEDNLCGLAIPTAWASI